MSTNYPSKIRFAHHGASKLSQQNSLRSSRGKQITNSKRGAVLLIAVLLSSVMLSVGLGAHQRTYKHLVFASFWKQMQVAFASADGGLECALYWDLRAPANYTCFGNSAVPWPVIPDGTSQTLSMGAYGGCAVVTITKRAASPRTTIQSRGYNDACGSTSSRRVERGMRIDY